ncbi:hypothetical protein OAE19_02700 [Porticoccaceae bacterium]|nr:hypothetical protein [Porticoccaceae bacterium]
MKNHRRLSAFLGPTNQTGAVLLVALLMLLVITALGVGSISMTNVNMQLVQNQQRKQETEQVVANTINYLLGDLDYYVNNSAYVDTGGNFLLSFPVNVSNGMSVTINKLECLLEAIPAGCSLLVGTSAPCHPEYYWEASVSVSDATSGALSTVIEGFKFKYLAGYCPI